MGFSVVNLAFVLICMLLFYAARGPLAGLRPAVLAFMSFVWLAWLSIPSAASLAAAVLVTFLAGLVIEKLSSSGRKKAAQGVAAAVIAVSVLILAFVKLAPVVGLRLEQYGAGSGGILASLFIPVGFSYCVFQIISYFADILKGRIRAERNFIYYALFLSFFPKLVSGPIERWDSLSVQFRTLGEVRLLDQERMSRAFSYMLTGFFMKLMIADRVADVTDLVFMEPDTYSALTLAAVSLLYTIQIYADFAGYSMIAIGLALLFGVQLVPNFNAPYMSTGIGDFWRRWHMSLSSWLRDYLYIPLGGNRKGLPRKCLNTMIVFLVCGFWHGAGMHFIFWGFLHGAYSVAENLIHAVRKNDKKQPLFLNAVKRIITFCLVSYAWIFFKVTSLSKGLRMTLRMLTGSGGENIADVIKKLKIHDIEQPLLLWSLLVMIILDVISYYSKKPFPEVLSKVPYGVKYLIWAASLMLILVFGVYGPDFDASQFMYMQF